MNKKRRDKKKEQRTVSTESIDEAVIGLEIPTNKARDKAGPVKSHKKRLNWLRLDVQRKEKWQELINYITIKILKSDVRRITTVLAPKRLESKEKAKRFRRTKQQ